MLRNAAFILTLSLLFSCKPEVYTPKKKGYFKIDLPEHQYQTFDEPGYPYKFEYPTYGEVIRDTSFFGQKPENPYWINIDFPKVGGRIYLSYKIIGKQNTIESLLEDSYEMTFTVHDIKADYIDDYTFHDDIRNVHGIFYSVGGDAASAYQFYATDSTRNFIRGALYFDVAPNADSLKPVTDFLKEDIDHMLKTLEWK